MPDLQAARQTVALYGGRIEYDDTPRTARQRSVLVADPGGATFVLTEAAATAG